MSFFETLSRKLGFTLPENDEENGEELDESESYDEDEEDEDEEERQPRFSFSFGDRAKDTRTARSAREPEEDEEEPAARSTTRRGNVIHDSRMDPRAAQETQYTHCERIVNVRQIEECRAIIQYLLRGESVLLNLENIDPKDCGRVVDLLSGAAFALEGRMHKVAHRSYLLAPENVEIIEEDVYAAAQPRYR